MAAAYATIANYGEYIEPTFYSKITDAEGNEIIGDHKKEEEYYQNKMLGYCKHYYKNQQEQV